MNGHSVALAACGLILGVAVGLMANPLLTTGETAQVAPWLEIAHRVCTSVGGLGTLAALIFMVRQFHLLRLQTQLLQKNVLASMESALYARLDYFNRFIVDHHEIYDLLNTPFQEQESPAQRAKLHHLCDLGFTFYEEIFKHYTRYKVLSAEDWTEWHANMQHFFGKPYVRGYWHLVSARYSRSFQQFVDDMYAGKPAPGQMPVPPSAAG